MTIQNLTRECNRLYFRVVPWVTNLQMMTEDRSSEADDDLEVDDDFPFELLEDPDEVYDILELDDVLELHFIPVILTSN